MFCEKCGNQIEDGAKFCDKCGAKMGGEIVKETKEKIKDDEIQLKVKPTFKFWYLMSGIVITFVLIVLLLILPIMVVDSAMAIFCFIPIFILFLFIISLKVVIKKKQYHCYEYNFYKTKVIYRDTFLNVSEKEVKYKYIRESTIRQTFIQRLFNIGNIVLYTNAETGFGNGIAIINVENPYEIYKQIKTIIDM